MNKSMIPKIVIIVAVIAISAIIIIPKLNGSSVKPQHEAKANFVDILVDDPAEQQLINKFGGVNTIPYSVFFDKSGSKVSEQVGVIDKEQLSRYLTSLEQ